jgi:hypothetical protein
VRAWLIWVECLGEDGLFVLGVLLDWLVMVELMVGGKLLDCWLDGWFGEWSERNI